MIEAIRNIGEYALKKEKKNVNDPLDILIGNPANRNTENILFILLDEKNGEFKYTGIEIEEFSKEKVKKYLYRKGGGARGTDITPTSMVTEIEKTFNIKILSWFKKYNSDQNNQYNLLHKIYLVLENNKTKIIQDLKEKSEKGNNIISLKINGNYLGDLEIFKNILVSDAKENYFKKFGIESKSEEKLCSVCKKRQSEVYGFVSTFNFYTVDKPGFVSGGFRQKNSWRNYPVCLNCALTLEEGREYLRDNLNFNFYGFRYLLIPKFVKGIQEEIQNSIFKTIKSQKDPKFIKKEIKRLTNDEDEALELMSKKENYLNNNFLFYYAPKGFDGKVFNILLYVEDILPSRLKKLFEAKEKIDQEEIFKNCMVATFNDKGKKDGEIPLEFNFGVLRTFFPKVSNNRTFDKYFLDVVNKIFTKKPVDYDFLLNFIMRKIRDDFINGYPTKIDILKAFMLLNYLNELYEKEGTIKMEKSILPKEIGGEIKIKIESFFDKFSNFFDSNIKKAIFLEGVLAQFLLNIQYQERKANPFRVKLKGLKLDEKQIRKLLPEIQNKLEEYGKNYYRDLESIISNYFVLSGNDWSLTIDEISFYFTLGMNLFNLFKKEKENGGNENE
jgi:CRISPR-associated protein Csh1